MDAVLEKKESAVQMKSVTKKKGTSKSRKLEK